LNETFVMKNNLDWKICCLKYFYVFGSV